MENFASPPFKSHPTVSGFKPPASVDGSISRPGPVGFLQTKYHIIWLLQPNFRGGLTMFNHWSDVSPMICWLNHVKPHHAIPHLHTINCIFEFKASFKASFGLSNSPYATGSSHWSLVCHHRYNQFIGSEM